jgi:hypothetical protein
MCDLGKHWCVQVNEGGNDVQTPGMDSSSDVGVPEVVNQAGPVSDAEAGMNDVQVPCTGFGCQCSTNTECESSFACVSKEAVTDAFWTAWTANGGRSNAGFCAKPCCTSVDCSMGDGGSGASVCFATGAGGNYCVPSNLLGDRSNIGSATGGASCRSTACRSGLCLDSGVCADTCCSTHSSASQPQCTMPSVCRFDLFPGTGFDTHVAANCSVALLAFAMAGQSCTQNPDCVSNLCVDSGLMFPANVCEDPCRNSGDCAGTFPRATCEYLQQDPTGTVTDIVAGCVPNLRLGGDAGMAVCFVDDPNINGDCPGARCRPEPLTIGSTNYSALACGM